MNYNNKTRILTTGWHRSKLPTLALSSLETPKVSQL